MVRKVASFAAADSHHARKVSLPFQNLDQDALFHKTEREQNTARASQKLQRPKAGKQVETSMRRRVDKHKKRVKA